MQGIQFFKGTFCQLRPVPIKASIKAKEYAIGWVLRGGGWLMGWIDGVFFWI
jgi:hypothetical protein